MIATPKFLVKYKFAIACLFVCFSIVFNFLNVVDSDPAKRLKWDGLQYDLVVNEYINGGYSFDAIKGDGLSNDLSKDEYTSRVGYTWLTAQIYRVTGANLVNIYLAISLLFFMATAILLMKLSMEVYNFNITEAF